MFLFRKKLVHKPRKIDFSKRKKNVAEQKSSNKSRFIRWGLLVVAVLVVFCCGYYYLKKCEIFQSFVTWQKRILKQPVKQILFHTDGNLNASWLRKYASLASDIDIFDVEIGSLQRSIKQCSQVKNVVVARKFPDEIEIKIEERKPILRVVIQDGRSKKIMYVDGEGVVFSLELGDSLMQNQLPFLAGVTLKKEGDGYQKINNVEKICELLTLAKSKYWPIYTQIEVIEISNLKKNSAPWSKIKMRCQFASQVIFKDGDFDEQLKRLDFILSTARVKSRLPVNCIDLTYPKDAIVRFRK